MQSTTQLSQRYLHMSRSRSSNTKSRNTLHRLLTYCSHTGLQCKHIWLGQVMSERYHSKCAHTIWYHSFRLRWSLLVGSSNVRLRTSSVLNYWTVCSQKPLFASQSYIHRLSAHLDTSKYTSSCIPKWLCAWVGQNLPTSNAKNKNDRIVTQIFVWCTTFSIFLIVRNIT